MTDKIVSLKGGPINEDKHILENMIKCLPAMLEYSIIRAQICRSDYLAYKDQGFTEEQALELSKSKF